VMRAGWPAQKQVVITMVDTFTIRHVTDVVDSLASELDMLSRRRDLSLRLMALMLQDAVKSANAEIGKATSADKASRASAQNPVIQLAVKCLPSPVD